MGEMDRTSLSPGGDASVRVITKPPVEEGYTGEHPDYHRVPWTLDMLERTCIEMRMAGAWDGSHVLGIQGTGLDVEVIPRVTGELVPHSVTQMIEAKAEELAKAERARAAETEPAAPRRSSFLGQVDRARPATLVALVATLALLLKVVF